MSPDGKWIVYGSTRPGEAGIWRARSDGSEAKVLARGLYGIPHVSPDGQYVLYMGFSSILVSTGVRVVRLSDGAPVDFELVAEISGRGMVSSLVLLEQPGLTRAR